LLYSREVFLLVGRPFIKPSLIVVLSLLPALLSSTPAPAQNSPAERVVPALLNVPESGPFAEDITLIRATISLLQAKNFTAAKEKLDPAVGQPTEDTLRQISDAFGMGEPASIEMISARQAHNFRTGENTNRLLLEYGFGSKWIVVDATVKSKGTAKQLLGLHVFTPRYLPLKELNAFHLLGKGMPQYLFLAVWIFFILMTAYAAYLAFGRNTGWQRWVLVLLMPLGLTPSVAMNWNTAEVFIPEAFINPVGRIIPLFAFRYPMALFGKTWPGALFLYISAPLIAVGYLIWWKCRPANTTSASIGNPPNEARLETQDPHYRRD
jgi:hypothetical protein